MKYQVIQHRSLSTFEFAVNRAIEEGWKPQGGICYVVDGGYTQFTQALIKED